jgi:hypothetical protein
MEILVNKNLNILIIYVFSDKLFFISFLVCRQVIKLKMWTFQQPYYYITEVLISFAITRTQNATNATVHFPKINK